MTTPTSSSDTNPTPPHDEDELNVENEVLEDAKKEQDLYDEMFQLSQDINLESEKYVAEEIKDKLKCFKDIIKKKDTLLEETRKELKISKHNCDLSKEVEERQHNELEDTRKESEKLKKYVKTQKDKLKKEKQDIEKELETVREDNGELNKENSDLKTKLNTNEGIIKNLNEALNIDDSDEVELI